MLSKNEQEDLKNLEESLWIGETRFEREYMENILCENFFEFGRSGKRYTREMTLSAPNQEIFATLPLGQFQINEISDDVVLITYISEVQYDDLEIGNRSSVWVKIGGKWKLRFHQGTPTKKV